MRNPLEEVSPEVLESHGDPTAISRKRTFAGALDDGAFFGIEHQLTLANNLGLAVWWELDLEYGRVVFHTVRGPVTAAVQVIGVSQGGIWTGGWASSLDSDATQLSRQILQVGLTNGIRELLEPSWTLPDPGPHSANVLTAGTKILHRNWTSYAFDTAAGEQVHAVLQHPDWSLTSPQAATVTGVLTHGAASLPITNIRRAVTSYADLRGLVRQWRKDRSAVKLLGANWAVTVTFDPTGRAIEAIHADDDVAATGGGRHREP
ncbi:MAG: DUF6882 domain-containing protein [Candidatus Nanopelagicales bacterium]